MTRAEHPAPSDFVVLRRHTLDRTAEMHGKPIYSMPDVERGWGKLVALYKAALV